MSDWRNYEYFKCPECGRTWRQYSVGAYDLSDSGPVYQPVTCCEECQEESEAA